MAYLPAVIFVNNFQLTLKNMVYVVFNNDGSINCIFKSKSNAESFCAEFGYKYKSFKVD